MKWLVLMCCSVVIARYHNRVDVYHVIDNALWGEIDGSAIQGHFTCLDKSLECNMYSSNLTGRYFESVVQKFRQSDSIDSISVGLYNIHTWKTESQWPHNPDICNLPTNLQMVESEESFGRFRHLFGNSFPKFDGNSTTNPAATVQRSYVSSLNGSEFLILKAFDSLIKGASFVASTCHRAQGTTKREEVVKHMQSLWRVDGLGKCRHTPTGKEGIQLKMGKTAQESLRLKQAAIANYMFYLAFENTKEAGYVTEKVFDALVAGTVPVYLGATADCKKLIPLPNGVIYLDDFNNDVAALTEYLIYLSKNATAYEAHRAWRYTFSSESLLASPMLAQSWPCRICDWARSKIATGYKSIAARDCLRQ